MNERIKALRTALHMNQSEFGERSHISRSMIACFESGAREMRDIHISQICSAFNVNEDWLRSGEGEMFRESDRSIIDQLAREYDLNELDISIVDAFVSLPSEYREGVRQFVRALVGRVESQDPDADLRAELDAVIDSHEASVKEMKENA
ncbi:MAG: helix-turn-helix transcriptional regulator [Clostridia bacterium]